MTKTLQKIIKHKIVAGIILLLVIGGGYFGYKAVKGTGQQTKYATAVVEKGTIVLSVSGSGQVVAEDQIDIKSKASGDVIFVGATAGQAVKAKTLLIQIDSRDAQRAVNDAEIALESAKIQLDELLAPPDAQQSLLGAQNVVSQAERDTEKAEDTYKNIETDSQETLDTAYENGYADVSAAYFKLPDFVKDLRDVLGTEKSEQEYINAYKLVLGNNSLFVQKLLDDYYAANELYNKNFTLFRGVFRDSGKDDVYSAIKGALETAKAVSQALESARHLYDAAITANYTQYSIAATIDKMQPKIESDLSAVFSIISALQQTVDTVDKTVKDTPGKVKDAELAFKKAQEQLIKANKSLSDIEAGADALDIRTQKNIVAQKSAALADAKDKLASCFLSAPFDGVVAKLNVKKGDSISSGSSLVAFDTKQKIAELSLNEVDAANIKIGQKATLSFDAISDFSVTGEVAEIDAAGEVSQGVVTYGAKIAFDSQDERIKPGMSLSAAIIYDVKQDVLFVSNSAVKQDGSQLYVEVIDGAPVDLTSANVSAALLNSLPRKQTVEIGLANDAITEITSGLKEGDKVVTQTITATAAKTQTSQSNSSVRIPGITGGGFR